MIVLDTHALIWWVDGDDRLSPAALRAIEDELTDRQQLLISAISAWETAMLIDHRRLVLNIAKILAYHHVQTGW